MPAGGGTTRGRAKVLARTPARAPQPAPRHYQGLSPTSYGQAQRAQRRAVPQPQRVLRRVTTGQRVSPRQSQVTPQGQALRNLFASMLFHTTAKFEDGTTARLSTLLPTSLVPYNVQSRIISAAGNLLANSRVGAGVGNVVAQQTWDKVAPLFQRSSKDMPQVKFGQVPQGLAGYTQLGQPKADVHIDDQILRGLFSQYGGARASARSSLQDVLTHEFAHTQQDPSKGYVASATTAPEVEGGADAFSHQVAPLFGRRTERPATNVTGSRSTYNNQGKLTSRQITRRLTPYGQSELQHFTTGYGDAERFNLPKILIGQFPRVNQRIGKAPPVAPRLFRGSQL